MRTVSLTLDDLMGKQAGSDGVLVRDPEGLYRVRRDSEGRPYTVGDLAGRVFTAATVSYTDSNGVRHEDVPLADLAGAAIFPLALRYSGKGFHTSPTAIVKELDAARDVGGALHGASDFSFSFSYFHPADAPLEAVNSYAYQGAFNIGEPTIMESPLAAVLELSGIVREVSTSALQALKRSLPALHNAKIMQAAMEQIRALTAGPGPHDYKLLLSTLVANHLRTEQGFAGNSYPPEYVHIVETF